MPMDFIKSSCMLNMGMYANSRLISIDLDHGKRLFSSGRSKTVPKLGCGDKTFRNEDGIRIIETIMDISRDEALQRELA